MDAIDDLMGWDMGVAMENDLAMIRAVPNSVTVANADVDVAAAARWHIGDTQEDAVAVALEQIAAAAETGGMPVFMS